MHVCTHVDSVMSINMYDNAQRGVVNKTCNRRGFPGWVLISEAVIVRTSQCPVQMSQRSAGHAEGNMCEAVLLYSRNDQNNSCFFLCEAVASKPPKLLKQDKKY